MIILRSYIDREEPISNRRSHYLESIYWRLGESNKIRRKKYLDIAFCLYKIVRKKHSWKVLEIFHRCQPISYYDDASENGNGKKNLIDQRLSKMTSQWERMKSDILSVNRMREKYLIQGLFKRLFVTFSNGETFRENDENRWWNSFSDTYGFHQSIVISLIECELFLINRLWSRFLD